MDISNVVTLAGQFGFPGLMVGYLVWRESQERKTHREQAELDRILARERIAADLELARSFVLLTATIGNLK